jgi:uncharacterized membrane protein (DUF4010 family)
MQVPVLGLPEAARDVIEALLIGFLIGAQREASHGERHPGVRDFVLIALTGGVCGLLQNAWLTVAALLSITALLAVYYFHIRERAGITTEMAAVATFALGFLVSTPQSPLGPQLAIGMAIVVVAFLEAKRSLHKLLRETITEAEFNDTLRFLALIFIIYPILPQGSFGPYQFFAPRKIWVFVILVSSISYAGYFMEKFLGATRGLKLAGIFGGLASTTAATASFARSCAEQPANSRLYAQAAVVANAIQFPRVLMILLVVSPALASSLSLPLVAMSVAGLLFGLFLLRTGAPEGELQAAGARNPFRLAPALRFGVLFTVILFAGKAAAGLLGEGAVYWTGALGGLLDVDAVAVSTADLLSSGSLAAGPAALCVLLALAANALTKAAIGFSAGTTAFGRRLAAGFVTMFAAGAFVWLAVRVAA